MDLVARRGRPLLRADLVHAGAARAATWRSAASEATAPLTPVQRRDPPVSTAPDGGPPASAVCATCGRADAVSAVVIGRHGRYLPRPRMRTTASLAARAVANPGLITVLMIAQPLVEVRERALHRVDREPLDVRPAVAERLRPAGANSEDRLTPLISRLSVFTVTRKVQVSQQPDRMKTRGRRRPGLQVRGRAHLQRDPPVPDIAGQPPERACAVRGHPDVVDDRFPVAQPVRAAPLQRLPDRGQPEPLPGVDREVEVLRPRTGRRPGAGSADTRLGPGDVEPDTPLSRCRTASSAISRSARRSASRSAARPTRMPRRTQPIRNPSSTAPTTCVQAQPPCHMQLGGEPAPPRRPPRRRPGPRRTRPPPGSAPQRAASPPPCARTRPDTQLRCPRLAPRRTTGRAVIARRPRAACHSRSHGPVRPPLLAADHRRGDRAAAP